MNPVSSLNELRQELVSWSSDRAVPGSELVVEVSIENPTPRPFRGLFALQLENALGHQQLQLAPTRELTEVSLSAGLDAEPLMTVGAPGSYFDFSVYALQPHSSRAFEVLFPATELPMDDLQPPIRLSTTPLRRQMVAVAAQSVGPSPSPVLVDMNSPYLIFNDGEGRSTEVVIRRGEDDDYIVRISRPPHLNVFDEPSLAAALKRAASYL